MTEKCTEYYSYMTMYNSLNNYMISIYFYTILFIYQSQ